MCTEFIVKGVDCGSVAELRAALGGEPIPHDYGPPYGLAILEPDHCLCCVSDEKTAIKFGLKLRRDEFGDVFLD